MHRICYFIRLQTALNSTQRSISIYTYNEHVYSGCFFAIAKRSQFHIAQSVSHLPFATGSIYVYQCGKQGPYLHGGIKRTVSLPRVARCARTYIYSFYAHKERASNNEIFCNWVSGGT